MVFVILVILKILYNDPDESSVIFCDFVTIGSRSVRSTDTPLTFDEHHSWLEITKSNKKPYTMKEFKLCEELLACLWKQLYLINP